MNLIRLNKIRRLQIEFSAWVKKFWQIFRATNSRWLPNIYSECKLSGLVCRVSVVRRKRRWATLMKNWYWSKTKRPKFNAAAEQQDSFQKVGTCVMQKYMYRPTDASAIKNKWAEQENLFLVPIRAGNLTVEHWIQHVQTGYTNSKLKFVIQKN